MPMHSTVLESSRLELQNATTFIKKYLFALDLSEPKFYKPKNVLIGEKPVQRRIRRIFGTRKVSKLYDFAQTFSYFFEKF